MRIALVDESCGLLPKSEAVLVDFQAAFATYHRHANQNNLPNVCQTETSCDWLSLWTPCHCLPWPPLVMWGQYVQNPPAGGRPVENLLQLVDCSWWYFSSYSGHWMNTSTLIDCRILCDSPFLDSSLIVFVVALARISCPRPALLVNDNSVKRWVFPT